MNKSLKYKFFFFFFFLYFSLILKIKLINNSINNNFNFENLIKYDIFNQTFNIYINTINKIFTKKTSIEKVFIIIILLPFIKSKKLIIKNYNKVLNKLFKNIFINNQKNLTIIKIQEKNIKINDLLYYKWDLIPEFNLIRLVRYIINKYYSESFLEMFDKSLNLNFKYFIKKNYNNFNFSDINNLMSKIFFLIVYRK